MTNHEIFCAMINHFLQNFNYILDNANQINFDSKEKLGKMHEYFLNYLEYCNFFKDIKIKVDEKNCNLHYVIDDILKFTNNIKNSEIQSILFNCLKNIPSFYIMNNIFNFKLKGKSLKANRMFYMFIIKSISECLTERNLMNDMEIITKFNI